MVLRGPARVLPDHQSKSNITFSFGDRISDAMEPTMESFVHLHEIAGANHYYSGPDQRETLRKAVGICTDWLTRHGFANAL